MAYSRLASFPLTIDDFHERLHTGRGCRRLSNLFLGEIGRNSTMIRLDYCGNSVIFKARTELRSSCRERAMPSFSGADRRTSLPESKKLNRLRVRCNSGRYFPRCVGHLAKNRCLWGQPS
jgi:hypothetical protein